MTQAREIADVVVVGSGVAGAIIADQLAGRGLKVLVVEAGKRVRRQEVLARYRGSWRRDPTSAYERQPHASFPDRNGDDAYLKVKGESVYWLDYLRQVGGSTWHWTGITPRYLPVDFKLRSTYGVGRDWPFSYAHFEPWYVRAEQEMGVSGDSEDDHGSPRSAPYPMPPLAMPYSDQVIDRRLRPHGYRVKVAPAARNSQAYAGRPACCGNNSCTPICPIGAQYSADTHVDKALKKGAQLLENAVVYNINVAASGRIDSIDYRSPDGQSHNLGGRFFVLACNGVETPKLLQMSRTPDRPGGVGNRSGLVGKGLMDHPAIGTTFFMPEPIYTGRGPQTVSVIDHGRDGDFRRDFAAGKMFLINTQDIQSNITWLIEHEKKWNNLDEALQYYANHYCYIGVELEQLPDLKNRVVPSTTEFDAVGIPKPEIHMEYDDYLLKSVAYFKQLNDRLLAHLGAKKIQDFEIGTALLPNHPMGTTLMGDDPMQSVVNADCRSHDHANLYVAGSSVFPSGSTANPTLTIAALSLRLAEHLKQRLSA